MKKSIRKFLALAVCLVLVCQFSTFASAAVSGYYSWDDGLLGKTITATFTDHYHYPTEITGAGQITHTKGVSGERVTYSGIIDEKLYAAYQSSGYDSYLNKAIENAGMLISTSVYLPASYRYIEIPASYESGAYELGIHFEVCEGNWNITDGIMPNSQTGTASTYAAAITSGVIYYVPTGEYILAIVPSYI